MKRLFVRYVSHEIRTPLNTVLMGLQYLRQKMQERDTPNDPTVEVINEVEGSRDAAISIWIFLLDYEKLESGILVLSKTRIFVWQLNQFMNSSYKLVRLAYCLLHGAMRNRRKFA